MNQRSTPPAPSRLLKSMMMNALPDLREASTARDEGHLIDVTRMLSGNDVIAIGFDISKAPVPLKCVQCR